MGAITPERTSLPRLSFGAVNMSGPPPEAVGLALIEKLVERNFKYVNLDIRVFRHVLVNNLIDCGFFGAPSMIAVPHGYLDRFGGRSSVAAGSAGAEVACGAAGSAGCAGSGVAAPPHAVRTTEAISSKLASANRDFLISLFSSKSYVWMVLASRDYNVLSLYLLRLPPF